MVTNAHTVLVSPLFPRVAESLRRLGMRVLLCEALPALEEPVRCHADLCCYPLGGKWLLLAPGAERLEGELRQLGFKLLHPQICPGGHYPADTPLCTVRVGEWLFCRKKSTDHHILHSVSENRILSVRQGYARCSTLAVGEHALVTADPTIAQAGEGAGLAVLQIQPGHIRLDGYDTGFIGGCGGMLGPKLLYLTGKLVHPDGERIRRFASDWGVQIIEGEEPELTDIGGVLLLDGEAHSAGNLR